jgi:hypothetical protein
MSDALRKDTSSKVADKVQPDSTKSTTEQIGDKTSGLADKAAGAVQPCMFITYNVFNNASSY